MPDMPGVPLVRTTNCLKRLNQEFKRRTRGGRIFPNREVCLRLVTALCLEQSNEWVSGRLCLDLTLFSREPTIDGEAVAPLR